MSSFAISGASRGIGLELIAQLLQSPPTEVSHVFAITRGPPSAGLDELLKKYEGRLFSIVIRQFTDVELVTSAMAEIESKLPFGQGLDYLVNNAGIMPWSTSMSASKNEDLIECFNVNVVATHTLTSALIPLLSKSTRKAVVNVSTAMGSIAYAGRYTFASTPEYKISKAAMNMLTAQYALEYADAGFTFLAISPGWVRTELGGSGADLEASTACKAIREILLNASPEQTGKFFNVKVPGWENVSGPNQYDGAEIPW